MITTIELQEFGKRMIDKGYTLGKTFGFILGADSPRGIQVSTIGNSVFWYKPDADEETYTHPIAPYIQDKQKINLIVNII